MATPAASVILPTCNRYATLIENIQNLRKQTVPVEIVVCDDTHIQDLKANRDKVDTIRSLADKYFYTALYDHENNKLYGLGRARNKGVIESENDILIFLDDRITPDKPNMVEVFVQKLRKLGNKYWIFGDKGAHKESFVENCSATWRQDLITAGMFCESVNSYGFMTRELYSRVLRQGWKSAYIPEALARPLQSGSRRNDEEREKQIQHSRSILKKMRVV